MIKRVFFFAVGFLLAAFSVFALAETIPATSGPLTFVVVNAAPSSQTTSVQGSYQAACEAGLVLWQTKYPSSGFFLKDCLVNNASAGVDQNFGIARYGYGSSGGEYTGSILPKSVGYSCPSGQNWTLNGSVCSRPDCVEPQTRQSDGTCKSSDPCEPTKDKHTSGWVSYTGDKVATGTVCIGSCNYEQNIMLDQDDRIGTDGRKWAQVGQTGLGTSCTGSTTPSMEPDQKNKESKKPPCAATDGVMTTSTGKVLCVPEGTPDARKPDVKVKTKTETFPDNTTKQTTETTTRDPLTGATSTSTSSTSTGKSDGTEGQAGPVGTTTGSSTSGSGNGDGDGEGCDPTLNFCGGPGTDGMYTKKEKTMASVFTQFQNTVKNSPVGSASTDFFAVSTPGGSCPAWSVQVPMLNVTLNAGDYFCNGTILAALQGAGYVMLALATYIAFTWAFL